MTLTAPFQRTARRRPGLRPLTTPSSVAFRLALPWLLGSLAMIMGSLVTLVPSWTLLVFAGCTLWRLRIEQRHGSMPSMPIRALVFLPVAFLLIRTYGARPTASGMLAFLISLISLKILELRSPRDFTIVALLSYFMVLSAFFYSQSLALSLYLVVAIAANTVALIRCHSGGRREVWPALRLAAGLSLQSLPLVILLFVVFPRVHGDFLRQFNGAQPQTGMSDHLTPGSFSSLAQSNELAFRAKIGEGKTVAAGELYWRGLVLEICEHSMSWRAVETGQVPPPPDKSIPGRIEQQITLIPQGERWLFALDRPVDVKGSSSVHTQFARNNILRSQTPIFNKAIYTAYSTLTPAEPRAMDDREHRLYTHLPADVSPRVLALAQGWKQRAHSEEEILQAASNFFRTGRLYLYAHARAAADPQRHRFLPVHEAARFLRTLCGGVQARSCGRRAFPPGSSLAIRGASTIVGAGITRFVNPTRTLGRRSSSAGAGSARIRRDWLLPSGSITARKVIRRFLAKARSATRCVSTASTPSTRRAVCIGFSTTGCKPGTRSISNGTRWSSDMTRIPS